MKLQKPVLSLILILFTVLFSCKEKEKEIRHVFEVKEIVLTAQNQYENPYRDVDCWVQLQGPGFNKRVYGFWDGGQTFKVRIVATRPGEWTWNSGSNQPDDNGLTEKKGAFIATKWTEKQKEQNPNRRGFIRATSNGHALEYADGTPFFFIGDTWWAASTWRYPMSGHDPDPEWQPGPENLTFENIFHYRQKQGYNSVAMIAAYPNWRNDEYNARYIDEQGIGVRQAWEKWGTPSAKDMHDEAGNLPFELTGSGAMADFDRINPVYFQSLDKKMDYLHTIGFVPFLETVRRDHGPSWKAYFDWPESFIRYIQYIAARYGAHNLIFSPLHLDWPAKSFSLPGNEFNDALIAWFNQYGPLPFGQPVTSLIYEGTHTVYGSGDQVPWLTMHSVGNTPRNHGFYPLLEEQFKIKPPVPTANLEPYYPGWNWDNNLCKVAGEFPIRNSDRDNYFGRAQAWGSVFSGGLAGHIYGTGAYDGTTVGENAGDRPYIWEALQYPAGEQVGYLRRFLESEGDKYQEMVPASEKLHPRESAGSQPDGLDGWSFMLLSPDQKLALLYFENQCELPEISGLLADQPYVFRWFNTIEGNWLDQPAILTADQYGKIMIDAFPEDKKITEQDWGLKILLEKQI